MFVLALGLFGTSLLFGEGIITPAISVLSAVEGIGVATPAFSRFIVPITVAILEQRIGVRAKDISPEHAAAGLAGRPLLVITDERDVRIPPFHQEAVFAAASEPKERWTAPNANHGRGHRAGPAEYEAHVLGFWAKTLGKSGS